jgi:hypothetical protein
MTDDEKPSERLVAQRVRNRITEEVWRLSRGNEGVRAIGPGEWFESFFDYFPYDGEPNRHPAMRAEEETAVRTVCMLMQLAIADAAIPKNPSVEEFTSSGWPEVIAPFAKKALGLMLERGRFSEDVEEVEPSTPVPWPYN